MRPRWLRPCILTIASAAVLAAAGAAVALATSPPAPVDQLRAVATGTLHGRFGTLTFGPSGGVQFSVLECGYLPTSPGVVRTFTDCAPDTTVGTVTVVPTGYQVTRGDGTVRSFAAYVDPAGQLHLGFGAVGQLSAKRTGSVQLSGGERLTVGAHGCTGTQGGRTEAVACRFVRDHGRTVLEYPVQDTAVKGGVRLAGLVYVKASRLLVSPELVERVYTR
jgi:hypothetical protein